jgi:tetratricopeptide (TPR) repeat protein
MSAGRRCGLWHAARAALLGVVAGAATGQVMGWGSHFIMKAWLKRDAPLAEYTYGFGVRLNTRLYGPDHPNTLYERMRYAEALHRLGRDEEAAAEFVEVINLRAAGAYADDALIRNARAWHARIAYDLGDYEVAERELRSVMEADDRLLGVGKLEALRQHYSHAAALYKLGRTAEAEAEMADVVARSDRALGADHPDTLRARDWLDSIRSELDPEHPA